MKNTQKMREAEFEKTLKQIEVIEILIESNYPPRSIRPNWKVGSRTFDIGIVDPTTEALIAVFQLNGYEHIGKFKEEVPFFFANPTENDLQLGYFMKFDEEGDGGLVALRKIPPFKKLSFNLIGERYY